MIYTVDVDAKPTVAFEAKNLREANELIKEEWFLNDLRSRKSDGHPLWDGTAPLRIRIADEAASKHYQEAAGEGIDAIDGLVMAFLVTLDAADEPTSIDPRAPPPGER